MHSLRMPCAPLVQRFVRTPSAANTQSTGYPHAHVVPYIVQAQALVPCYLDRCLPCSSPGSTTDRHPPKHTVVCNAAARTRPRNVPAATSVCDTRPVLLPGRYQLITHNEVLGVSCRNPVPSSHHGAVRELLSDRTLHPPQQPAGSGPTSTRPPAGGCSSRPGALQQQQLPLQVVPEQPIIECLSTRAGLPSVQLEMQLQQAASILLITSPYLLAHLLLLPTPGYT